MKKLSALLISLAMIASLAACGTPKAESASTAESSAPAAEAQTYTSTAKGFGGEFTVEVQMTPDQIVAIAIGEHSETEGLGAVAIEQLPAKIMENQSIAIDGVSGATVTSTALLGAVADCITQSGADLAKFQNAVAQTEEKEEDMTIDTDVVVVGAGGAGLTASIMVKDAGKEVVLIEKMPIPGGNTIKATGGMNASQTIIQEKRGGSYTNDEFYDFTFKGGQEKANPELLRYYVEHSGEAVQWLYDLGMNFTWEEGTTVDKLHSVNNGGAYGPELMRVLTEKTKALGIEPMLNTKAVELIKDENGVVTGVIAQGKTGNTITINAKAVILATGGFGANEELYTKYRPELKGYVTTNHAGATGDGIVMAEAVGADLTDIGEIQIHPTVEQGTASLITEMLRTDGAILVNTSGARFFDECSTRDKVSAAILEQDQSMAYLVLDQGIRDVRAVVNTYVEQGFMQEFATIGEMAQYMGVEAAVLEKTIADWNSAVAAKKDEAFGSQFSFDRDLSHAPYYAVKVAPGVHHTMGGLKINTKSEVISTEGSTIPGLFAAGEVTGGIHGGNRIGGNAVTDIVVFGRTAGQSAVEYLAG